MKTPSTRIHVTRYCQILVVSSTPTTVGMMKHLADMTPPADPHRGHAGDATPFKIILSGSDRGVVDIVTQARQAQHPASLVVVDLQKCNDWDAEHLIGALLTADPALQILLLIPAGAPLGTRLVTLLSRCHRMAVLKLPCDEVELGQLVRVMLAKWLTERANLPVESDGTMPPAESVTVPVEPPPPAPPVTQPLAGRPSTILAVEDDETVLWMMTKVLETQNFNVLSATNAEDAWQKWRENINTIKLVITDINMPGGPNGVALGHAIQDEDGSVPVIYTSGNRAVQEFAELRAGTNYLVKPFRMDALLEIVNRALIAQENQGISPPSRLVSWDAHPSAACETALVST